MYENYKKSVLDCGIRLITEELTHIESFTLGIWIDSGSRDEAPEENGISHFLEHMFFKGTEKRNAEDIAISIESLGGELNAFTSKEHTCIYAKGMKDHLPKIFEVLLDMLENSKFKNSEIKKESEVIIDELKDIDDCPEELIFDEFEAELFKGNPIAMTILGPENNILSFRKENLMNFVGRHYGFNNIYIVASGNVNHETLKSLAESQINKDFGLAEISRGSIHLKAAKNRFIKKDIQQTHVIIGAPEAGYKESDRTGLLLLSYVLGEGSGSRLFQQLREKRGIAYQINSFLNSFYDISTLGVYFSTKGKSVSKGLDLIREEFGKINSDGISESEITRAKEYLIGGMLMGDETTSSRMLRIAQSEIYYGRLKTMDETIGEIKALTRADLMDFAGRALRFDKMAQMIIGPKKP